MLEYIGYACVLLAIGSSVIGFISIFGLRSHLKNWSQTRPEKYPALTIIAPQRGKINPKNIEALLGQNYPGVWEVIFVTTQDDASLPHLEKYSAEHKNVRTVIADDVVELAKKRGIHRCQKNNNLIAAIGLSSPDTEVYVIVDADARPFSDWLCNLVAPLANGNSRLGAVTSARMYIPGKGLASLVQVSWILISSTFLVGKFKYIWGGGLAIPKDVFEKANLMSHINGKGGCSITTDDMNIYVALREQGYDTLFVPHCILFRYPPEKTEKLSNVVSFTNRQALQTWWTNKIIFIFMFVIGIRSPLIISALIIAWWYPLCLLALLSTVIDIVMGMMVLKTVINAEPRLSVKLLFWEIRSTRNHSGWELEPKVRSEVNIFLVALLPIITPFVVTINSVFVPFFNKMRWSGIEYEKRSVVGYTGNFSWRAKQDADR